MLFSFLLPWRNCRLSWHAAGPPARRYALSATRRQAQPRTPPRTRVDRQIFHQVAINSGNLELQRLNTGLAGFKISNVAGPDALFSPEARNMHRGLSHYVKV